MSQSKFERRNKIKLKIRGKIAGTSTEPRLSVFRSNSHIYAQLINDDNGTTIASYSSKNVTLTEKSTKTQLAEIVGKEIAKKALDLNLEIVKFDRSGYLYHGRVKALADAARTGGLKF